MCDVKDKKSLSLSLSLSLLLFADKKSNPFLLVLMYGFVHICGHDLISLGHHKIFMHILVSKLHHPQIFRFISKRRMSIVRSGRLPGSSLPSGTSSPSLSSVSSAISGARLKVLEGSNFSKFKLMTKLPLTVYPSYIYQCLAHIFECRYAYSDELGDDADNEEAQLLTRAPEVEIGMVKQERREVDAVDRDVFTLEGEAEEDKIE